MVVNFCTFFVSFVKNRLKNRLKNIDRESAFCYNLSIKSWREIYDGETR